jgi:hypothetical protein
LAASGACTGTNNSLFATSVTALQIGASDITTPATYSICVKATDATFTNSPFYQALTLTGTGAGLVVTTATFQNDTGSTLPAGTPVSFGQGFRYGDIMPGTYPLIRDASTHVALPGQQWDEVATYHENGGNSSWRHAVWAAWLPASVANGATYQVEFLTTTGTYSESSRQPLSVLCSGAAAHDLKIHLTDVRNQNDTLRDSGDATFDICSNIANTGRDAPRHVRSGNVYDEYIVSGMPLYTSGHYDPLLYAQCIVDIFTKASDGTSAGDARWVCHMHNSWENVTPGSSGNSGNPGPVGFANDPQAISYRAEIDDGASDVLDWSGLDATVTSASNPIVNAASNGCNSAGETVCLNVPSSTGANAWYMGQATRVSSTGTPVAGLTNGQLYYIWPSSSAAHAPPNTQYVNLMKTPAATDPFSMTSSQGSGSTTFSTRVQHYHFETWQTLDASGQDNWAPFGTTTRVTRKVYPAFTPAEARYWQETGLVIPINLSQPTPNIVTQFSLGLGVNYEPFGRLNVIGGSAAGQRPDLGIVNEWSAKAFITQAQADWDNARLFTLGTSMHGYSTLLDESTGRISPLNNGPPSGPGGNGNGGTYAGLGALRNQISWTGTPPTVTAIANPLHNVPSTSPTDIAGGTINYGTQLDHMPSFDGFTYMIFGDRHFLDLMEWHGNRDFAQQRVGPGPELGQGYYRDNNAKFTDGNTYHYYGLTTVCCQGRGSAWLTRDVLNAAAFGADSSPERQLFNDMITETGNYWPLFLNYRDGPGSAGYSLSIYPPAEPDTVASGILNSNSVMTYDASVSYEGAAWLHTPVFNKWNAQLQRYMEGVCGQQVPGAISDFYCTEEKTQPQIANGNGVQTGFGGNVGQYMNGTDASDFGNFSLTGMPINPNGLMEFNGYPALQLGDTLKFIYNGWPGSTDAPIDQLPGARWFPIINIDNSGTSGYAHTFNLQCNAADHTAWPTQCPTAGGPFTSFTRGGVALSSVTTYYPKLRLTKDPGAGIGYVNNSYSQYAGQTINGLAILGYPVPHAQTSLANRCTASPGAVCYSTAMPSFWWDPTITVPGMPTPINTAEWALTSASVSGATVADYSAGDNPATVVNGPLTFGALGANFDGSTQYLDSSLGLPPSCPCNALTVAVWFSPASLSNGNPRLVANSHTDVDFKGFQLAINNGGAGGFFDVGNGTAEGRVSWSQQLAVGTWYHYVGVYDGATVKAYINGVQVASTAFAGGAIAAGTGPDINVGRNPAYTSDYFSGAIYDVRIYGQALSANQILALYNSVTPPAPPPASGKIDGEWYWAYNPPTIATTMSQAPKVNYLSVPVLAATSTGQTEVGTLGDANWGSNYPSQAAFKSDVSAWLSSGRKMTFMIGGGTSCGNSPAIANSTNVSQFMSSIASLVSTYGINGVEFDLEDQYPAGCQRVDPPSLASLIQNLKSTYGSGFIVALDPSPYYLRQCFAASPWNWSACGPTGEYRQAILDAGISNVDFIAIQSYALAGDSLSGQRSYMDNDLADWIGNLTGLLIPANKLLIGSSGSCTTQGGCGSGNESSVTATQTYQYYLGVYPTLRGNMNWETNLDSSIGWAVAVGIGALQ